MHTEDPMRKFLLNMTMTLDGFFGGPNGELDWITRVSQNCWKRWSSIAFTKIGETPWEK